MGLSHPGLGRATGDWTLRLGEPPRWPRRATGEIRVQLPDDGGPSSGSHEGRPAGGGSSGGRSKTTRSSCRMNSGSSWWAWKRTRSVFISRAARRKRIDMNSSGSMNANDSSDSSPVHHLRPDIPNSTIASPLSRKHRLIPATAARTPRRGNAIPAQRCPGPRTDRSGSGASQGTQNEEGKRKGKECVWSGTKPSPWRQLHRQGEGWSLRSGAVLESSVLLQELLRPTLAHLERLAQEAGHHREAFA